MVMSRGKQWALAGLAEMQDNAAGFYPPLSFQEVAESRDGELVTMSSSQPTSPAEHKRRQHPTLEQLETLPVKAGSVGGPESSSSSGHAPLSRQGRANGLAKLVIHQHEPRPAPPPEDEDQMRLQANGIDNGHEDVDEEAKEASHSSGAQ